MREVVPSPGASTGVNSTKESFARNTPAEEFSLGSDDDQFVLVFVEGHGRSAFVASTPTAGEAAREVYSDTG